jgi:hypothetical protein
MVVKFEGITPFKERVDHPYRNPTLRKCEDETHTPEMGTWESSGTPETLKFDYKGQNTLHWGVFLYH